MPTRDRYAPGTPCWVDLSTSDTAEAQAFYSALFGWEWDAMPTPMGIPYFQASLQGRRVAGLTEQPTDLAGAPAFWSVYLASDDCDETARRVEAAGGTVMMAPDDVMEQGRMAMGVDPTGAVFGVWQAGAHVGSEVVNEAGAPTWMEVRTAEPERAVDFYGEVFGLGATTMPSDPSYRVLTVGDDGVAGVTGLPGEAATPTWFVTFAVDDCESAVDRATGAGGAVLAEPTDVAPGRMAVLADPHHGAFAVIRLT